MKTEIEIIKNNNNSKYGYYVSITKSGKTKVLISNKDFNTKQGAEEAAQRAINTFENNQ